MFSFAISGENSSTKAIQSTLFRINTEGGGGGGLSVTKEDGQTDKRKEILVSNIGSASRRQRGRLYLAWNDRNEGNVPAVRLTWQGVEWGRRCRDRVGAPTWRTPGPDTMLLKILVAVILIPAVSTLCTLPSVRPVLTWVTSIFTRGQAAAAAAAACFDRAAFFSPACWVKMSEEFSSFGLFYWPSWCWHMCTGQLLDRGGRRGAGWGGEGGGGRGVWWGEGEGGGGPDFGLCPKFISF